MITVKIPRYYEPERRYIISLMFAEFLGLETQIELSDRKNVIITRDDDRELVIADKLFTTPTEQWLKPASLPKQPLKTWNLSTSKLSATTVNPQIPIIYGDDPNNPNFFRQSDEQIYLGLDIFGSAFFMLTRYEEIIKPERDSHDRFPASASLAYQEGFLDRPIINEYLEILWACLKHLWSGLKRKPRNFQTYISHDVDEPFRYAFTGILPLIKRCAGDTLKRRNTTQAVNNISNWIQVKTGNPNTDPCNNFDLIMDISEKHNLKSAFYFITDHSAGKIDGVYNITHPLIRSLLHKIHQRGHEIGLHTSYNTYTDTTQTKKEFEILKQVCAEEGIQQNNWGGRQHFLRWQTPTTFQNWENAGLDYDSTLCFADMAGFRCGICYEFPTFNVNTRQTLKLRERPLIVMECTVIDERYMNLGLDGDAALQMMTKFKQRCQLFEGDFTLLWHNSRLVDEREVGIYRDLVSI
ncbi:polysaccharide deacetylase family protein [Rivularia sp. UHCC 0363]|uniref:polysaccharide deacetylase family protein n=1 Tax=Rivularia sp. UHCC 0363 TaxID=3110244 RepID=UPI002B21F02D|nr:polysaccharide deacetylase family protein [Rivularia sp. UHCC 0363]MEA5598793.1 polysaccharide deacetylase family protein [Rivularia sp. UHCC 0363]